MSVKTAIVIALVSSTAFATATFAASDTRKASETATTTTAPANAGTNTADPKFSKLSKEGFQAFQNIRMARLAIFDGKPDEAKKLVSDTQNTLKSANLEESSFMKAENQMHLPKAVAKGTLAAQAKPAGQKPSTEQVAWLPIDGQIMLSEHLSGYARTCRGRRQGQRFAEEWRPEGGGRRAQARRHRHAVRYGARAIEEHHHQCRPGCQGDRRRQIL